MRASDRLTVLVERVRGRLSAPGALDGVMLLLGALTGLLTGLLASALILAVRAVQGLAWGDTVSTVELVLVPLLGGAIVGVLVTSVVPESSGGGVVRTMETIALRGGRFRGRVPLAGLASTSIAIGTGASGGRESPIVLMGGATGSVVGQLLALDEERMMALVSAGVAAGIGAAFNAPIGGMLFAIEVILRGVKAASLQVVVVASVVASVTAREIVGDELTFRPAVSHSLNDPRELVLYGLLGLAAAAVALAFTRGEALAATLFAQARERVPAALVVALGGGLVGLIALAVPEVLGTGHELPPIDGFREPIQAMIDGEVGVGWTAAASLLLLVVAKLVATSISIGSGSAVGNFAPALFMGAALGAAFGAGADLLLAVPTTADLVGGPVEAGAFALVGMAAVLAAMARTPLTAVLLVFELTGDYGLVLPLMLSVGIATFAADRVQAESMYARALRQRGVVYGQPEDIDVMQTVRCEEVMTRDHPTVNHRRGLGELQGMFRRTGSHGFAVVDDDGHLVGVVTRRDLVDVEVRPDILSGRRTVEGLTADDVCTHRVLTVHPDDPVFRAVHRMAAIDVGRIPVVTRDDRRLVGMIRRADVVRAYQRGLTRSMSAQQRRASGRLRNLGGVRFVEVAVDAGSPIAERAVREVSWPRRTVLTSIRRRGSVVMPTGDTVIEPGDELVVLTDDAATEDVTRLVTREGTPTAEPAASDDVNNAPGS